MRIQVPDKDKVIVYHIRIIPTFLYLFRYKTLNISTNTFYHGKNMEIAIVIGYHDCDITKRTITRVRHQIEFANRTLVNIVI